MRALIQRVSSAKVEVGSCVTGEIARGILLLLGVQKGDTCTEADKLLKKVLDYRIFPDDAGKINCSLRDIGGALEVNPVSIDGWLSHALSGRSGYC